MILRELMLKYCNNIIDVQLVLRLNLKQKVIQKSRMKKPRTVPWFQRLK